MFGLDIANGLPNVMSTYDPCMVYVYTSKIFYYVKYFVEFTEANDIFKVSETAYIQFG